jgi:transcriptional regulator with XRE-family HTH domain
MLKKEKLIRTKEYWMETIQNDLFRNLKSYMESRNLNQADLAKEWGVTRGYISQVLNGNFNFTIGKLVELALAIGVAPDLEFKSFSDYLNRQGRDRGEAPPAKNKNRLAAVRRTKIIPGSAVARHAGR